MRYAIALYLAIPLAHAQPNAANAPTSTVSLSNGLQVQISTSLGQPTGQQSITVEMSRAGGDSFYRIFRDQNHLAVFAYELKFELVGDRLRVTGLPAEAKFAVRYPGADGGKPVPSLSADTQIGLLSSGQKGEIGLFQLEGMGVKVVDTVLMKIDEHRTPEPGSMLLSGLRLSVNKTLLTGSNSFPVTGKFALIYIPGKGGYFLSTQSVAGKPFLAAGTIDRDHMTFTVDSGIFDITAAAPILANPDSGSLYVYHDPNYRPAGTWTLNRDADSRKQSPASVFFVAASDSLDWWLMP